jgi:nucleoside-diphosphate-sugar epimerase
MSRILITGATGFIGSHLAELLVNDGHDVTCLKRKTSSLKWLKDLNVSFQEGEVTKPESLREAVRDKDMIFHLASLTKAVNSADYYRVNAEGTRNLLKICLEENPGIKRFVLVSSQAAAGPSPSEQPIDETWPPGPITDYGKSKLEAEKIAATFMDKIPITIVRPPAVYGQREKDIHFYFSLINKGWLLLVGSKDQLVSIVFAPDLALGMLKLAEEKKAAGETYFIASPKPCLWSALSDGIIKALKKKKVRRIKVPLFIVGIIAAIAELVSKVTRKPALLNRQKMLEVKQAFWVCSAGKMERHTGFSCPTPIEKGLEITAEWYKKNGWL